MPDAAIWFRAVSFTRGGGLRVLDRFDLTVESGEVLALVGRSGAGKTTLLKLVNRLLLPDAGAVLVEGRDTREWEPIRLRRRAGYVLQEIGLFPHMTVAGNIGVVPRLEGWTPERVTARVGELLDLIGLPSSFASRWPDELSGGQRQRVGVARALAVDPPVLLMDEPFGALDPLTRAELHAEFRRIQARLRKTVIIVTHDMGEAFALGDRIGVLEEGKLIACEPPATIVASKHPAVRRLLDAVTVLPLAEAENLGSSAAPAAEPSGGGAPRAAEKSASDPNGDTRLPTPEAERPGVSARSESEPNGVTRLPTPEAESLRSRPRS